MDSLQKWSRGPRGEIQLRILGFFTASRHKIVEATQPSTAWASSGSRLIQKVASFPGSAAIGEHRGSLRCQMCLDSLRGKGLIPAKQHVAATHRLKTGVKETGAGSLQKVDRSHRKVPGRRGALISLQRNTVIGRDSQKIKVLDIVFFSSPALKGKWTQQRYRKEVINRTKARQKWVIKEVCLLVRHRAGAVVAD